MSTCVHIQLLKEDIGMIYLKSEFDGEFKQVDLNRTKRKSQRLDDRPLFASNLSVKKPVPISLQIYQGLLSLLPFVPSFCHSFYKDLPRASGNHGDYPDGETGSGDEKADT